jgi:hypothetical protein
VDFKIPADLQNQLGLSIALTDFNVQITGKPFAFKVKGKKIKASYLQLTGCPGGKVPVEAVGHFSSGDVTSDSTSKC